MIIPPEYNVLFYASDSDYESWWGLWILERDGIYYRLYDADFPGQEPFRPTDYVQSFDPADLEIITENEALTEMLDCVDDEEEWENETQ